MQPKFFKSQREFRKWLERNHGRADEIFVGFRKKGSAVPSVTYKQAVDEALCFGWIDGVRRSIDADSYANRFTPRRPGSAWSAINITRVKDLLAEGRMHAAGIAAFEKRDEERAGEYSYERKTAQLDAASKKAFRAKKAAWEFFHQQPASYRRLNTHWVMSAKRQETKQRRLDTLIEASKHKVRLDPMKSPFEQVAAIRNA